MGLALLILLTVPHGAAGIGSDFTYQGQLEQNGSLANGACDFRFLLFDTIGSGVPPTGGTQIGTPVVAEGVHVSDGLFTLRLDFGAAAFNTGADRFLQVAVRCPGGSGAYQTLTSRQPLTAAPFALFASAVADGAVSSAKLAPGAVTTSQLAPNAVTAAQIADGTIATGDLASGAVTTAQIADGTIATGDLANGAVTTAKIGDGQVTGAKLVAPLRLTSAAANTTIGALDGTSTGSNGIGVSGTAGTGANSAGVLGSANAGDGVRGLSTSGVGVVGVGADAGVEGTSNQDGVLGTSTGFGDGVAGVAMTGAGVRGLSLDGIGVLGDGAELGIKGTSATGDGIMGVSTKPFGGGVGVIGIGAGDGMPTGVRGESPKGTGVSGSGGDVGVQGYGQWGVYGLTDKPDGYGVLGDSRAANDANSVGVSGSANQGIGVRGRSGTGFGVHGLSNGSGSSGDGVRGTATGPNGNGVHGISNNGTGAYGVYGESTSGFAGYFSGKVTVTGNLSKGGGSFIIDHPLDPAHKYLSHSFVESPDMKNIYDGIAVLDADGRAEIALPDWFQALNRDFRYQLTCIGAFAPVYVAEKIHDNRFAIAGGAPGQSISWQVTGIRQDAYANAHRIVVEEPKPAEEVGHYLHPAELGMPASMSMTASKDAK